MLRVVAKLLLAAAAVAAVWSFVPIGGRSMGERWRRARTPSEFVERTWAEIGGAPAAKPRTAQRPQARTAPARAPTESHRESDRRELDRILSEHLQE